MNRLRPRRVRRPHRFALQHRRYHLKRGILFKRSPFRRGFTLTELLVASLLMSVVILIAWTGLISALNMSNIAEAKTARQTELSRALTFMNQEIRQAQAINSSGPLTADGSTVSLEDVVSNAGLNLNNLGNYGDLALYLEVPTNSTITTCPAGDGVNPVPADEFDRVVYDVRNSPSTWLAPRAIARYGRIPASDGTINPCSAPVTGDIMADAITDINETPFCDGVLTGGAGFHACMKDDAVNLMVKSAIRDVEVPSVTSTVTSRSIDFTQPTTQSLDLVVARSGGHHVNISWFWNISFVGAHDAPYTLTIKGPDKTEIQTLKPDKVDYKFDLNKVASNDTDTVCFELETTNTNNEIVNSNRVCAIKAVEVLSTPSTLDYMTTTVDTM